MQNGQDFWEYPFRGIQTFWPFGAQIEDPVQLPNPGVYILPKGLKFFHTLCILVVRPGGGSDRGRGGYQGLLPGVATRDVTEGGSVGRL